jgi:hypothetical protein
MHEIRATKLPIADQKDLWRAVCALERANLALTADSVEYRAQVLGGTK